MNSDHVATIREALTEWQHSIFDGCNIGKLDDPDQKICEIDAALAALEEDAGWEMLPDGPIPDSNLYVTVAHPDGWFLEFGKNGAKIWFPDVVRLFRKRQPAQEGDA